MSAAISSITNTVQSSATVLAAATTAASALGNLLLATPSSTVGYQPQNPSNANGTPSTTQLPPSFLFDFEGEQSGEFTSDITDHFVEDNTSIEDQIALKPVIIRTLGYISELNNVPPKALAALQAVVNTLTTLGAYSPKLSLTAQLAYNQAFQVYQTASNAINTAVSAWSSIGGTQGTTVINGSGTLIKQPNQNKQQTAFQTFYGYWLSRTLFTIQTPWAVFQNMAIQSIRVVESEETKTFSTFECTFKQIRTASTYSVLPQSAKSQGRLGNQSSSQTNQGTSTPPTSIPLTTGLTGSTSSSYSGIFSNAV